MNPAQQPRRTIFVTIQHPQQFAPRTEHTDTHIVNFIHKRCATHKFPIPIYQSIVADGQSVDQIIAQFLASL